LGGGVVKRGDLVTVAVSGDYGKPRPALVVQADAFSALGSVTVLRLTSELHDWPSFRVTVEPSAGNGLRVASQVMIDKAAAVPLGKIGAVIGRLDAGTMRAVDAALVRFLGLEGAVGAAFAVAGMFL
jgi:mRNA interferase MazF